MSMKELSEDYATVLQQINEDGADDLTNLAETLRFDKRRLIHIIQALHHKGLVIINNSSPTDIWLTLSARGKHFMQYAWPESSRRPAY